MKVLILSDTHSYLDPRIKKHIKWANQVWHAGDIGTLELMDQIKEFKPLIGVHGNIDDHLIKREYPLDQVFKVNGKKVVITHIAGYPGRYRPRALKLIQEEKPDLFICGHSHVLKVIYDKQLNHLHINPGAIGNKGFHAIQTAIKMEISDKGEFKNLEIIELKREKVN